MPSEKVAVILGHILQEIDYAEQFTLSLTADAFAADALRLRAVTRCLEVISEASRRLPAELKSRHPGIPWTDIAGSGNVYRHDYQGILPLRVWETAMSLGELRRAIVLELRRET